MQRPERGVSARLEMFELPDTRISTLSIRGRLMSEEKLYTVEEANDMLPWVVEQLGIAAEAADRLSEARSDQAELESLSRSNGHGDIDSRLSDVRADARRALDALRSVLDEFEARGIPVPDCDSGLTDFPAGPDGPKGWPCWGLGAPASCPHINGRSLGWAACGCASLWPARRRGLL